MCIVSSFFPGMLYGSLFAGKIFLTPSNRLVSHRIRHKAHKETTSFILNGGVTVQAEGHMDYHTEWSFSPAIELPTLHESIIVKEKRKSVRILKIFKMAAICQSFCAKNFVDSLVTTMCNVMRQKCHQNDHNILF